jgi:hypothetical protein
LRILRKPRGHHRARADAAVEDDRPVGVERRGLARQRRQLDVARAGDVAGLTLVGLAHVDYLQRGVFVQPRSDALGFDSDLGRLGRAHASKLAARSRASARAVRAAPRICANEPFDH